MRTGGEMMMFWQNTEISLTVTQRYLYLFMRDAY
jgi:hypothetical protein